MARIAIAWEMGSGMGHVRYLSELAGRLQTAGHRVTCIMREVHTADRELARHGIPVLPAPRLPRPNLKAEMTVNLAELLIVAGYLQPGALTSLIRSWRALFGLLETDLLVANHSFTALLAARGFPARVVNLGTGFAVPPRMAPMPTLLPWIEVPEERLIKSEELVVAAINAALADFGQRPIDHLHELLHSDQEVLTTFAELDHYAERPDARYWGPIINSARGDPPDWPAESTHSRRIFCYLKQKHPLFRDMLEALSSIDAAKLVFAAGLDEQQAERFGGRDFRFAPRPVDLQAASRQSDLVVCHAGHGTVSTSLLSGTPMVLIPENRQLEQTITARNVCRMGAARTLDEPETGKKPAEQLRDALDAALSRSEPAAAARRFAAKHADFDPQRQLTEITELCSSLAES